MSDVFCFPSLREGLGVAAIEAMASGLPLITSSVHGINDYSVDGVTGYKCDATDVQGFAEAINKLRSNTCLQAEYGRGNAFRAKKYEAETIIALLRKIY